MPKIDELFAFIAEDASPDDEGIAAYWHAGMLAYMPLVGADRARVDALRKWAQEIATVTKKRMKLVRFSVREELEQIEP